MENTDKKNISENIDAAGTEKDSVPTVSRHIGTPGDTWIQLVESIKPAAQWGRQTLYIITTRSGDILTCKTRRHLEMGEPGSVTGIRVTIKKHSVHKGVNQTWVRNPHMIYIKPGQ